MDDCPFLSTYDKDVECFKGCALYNYKDTGGICPFKRVSQYSCDTIVSRNDLVELYEKDFPFIGKSFFEERNQYF